VTANQKVTSQLTQHKPPTFLVSEIHTPGAYREGRWGVWVSLKKDPEGLSPVHIVSTLISAPRDLAIHRVS
jgi:hypothetical protein